MADLNLIIDNKPVTVPEGTTILEAAKKVHINIPHLCYHPDQAIKANCRLCVVQIKGGKKLSPACSTYVWDGMEIDTNTEKVRDMQKGVLELILANHDQDCLKCQRNGNCELQSLCERFNISKTNLDEKIDAMPIDDTNPSLVRDPEKCIKCDRCVEACQKTQEVNILSHSDRSKNFGIVAGYNTELKDTLCTFCGQCSAVCPVGAIVEKDDTDKVWEAIHDPKKHVIVQVAPAVRVALGDSFNLPNGEIVTGKMISALRILGFDKVFDTNFTADLTILEEGHELIDRVTNGGTLPMITSCSPGWINFIEGKYDSLLDHLSTCKSPQQMFGALSKSYYPDKTKIPVEDIYTVSIMPCTAKKYECQRPEMKTNGVQEVDAVLTTRELGRMINSAGIEFNDLEDDSFDTPFGIGSGAGAIFGATGGVMEAALRTVADILTGKDLDNFEYQGVRGLDGVKEASVVLPIDGKDTEIKVAVAHGTANAAKVLDAVKKGEKNYHFIEVMACPGGCVHGGGQSHVSAKKRLDVNPKAKRADALYELDKSLPLRKSHKNPEVIKLYEEFLKEPNSHVSHKYLHTHYYKRDSYATQEQEEYDKLMEKLK